MVGSPGHRGVFDLVDGDEELFSKLLPTQNLTPSTSESSIEKMDQNKPIRVHFEKIGQNEPIKGQIGHNSPIRGQSSEIGQNGPIRGQIGQNGPIRGQISEIGQNGSNSSPGGQNGPIRGQGDINAPMRLLENIAGKNGPMREGDDKKGQNETNREEKIEKLSFNPDFKEPINVFKKNQPSVISGMTAPQYYKPITARRRTRLASLENTELTEVLTIYEKLKKGKNLVFRHSRFDATARIDIEFNEAEETVPITPIFNQPAESNTKSILDFNKYQNLKHSKYFYFSESTQLLQSELIEELSPNFESDFLLSAKNFWLNIFDPNERDFNMLFNSYGVHDLTLNDIREGNTEDKVEVYKHYTFFSMRLMCENIKERKENEDIDFNILLFKDFIITMHDKQWSSIADILGFLNLLISHSKTPLTPDWVMFSCFVELIQDARYVMQVTEPAINRIRVETKEMEMSDIMRRIFELELQVYSIGRFVKPKIRVLSKLKLKCNKRINKMVMSLLKEISDEFREQTQDLNHFNHLLERSQDTFLAIVSADQSREANEMSLVMKRISEVALVFLPMQAVSGFFGMNVLVPFQSEFYPSPLPFWLILSFCILLGVTMYFLRTRILAPSVGDKRNRRERRKALEFTA